MPEGIETGLYDREWSEDDWSKLLHLLVEEGVLRWKDVTALVVGHLNPPQVGTALASSEGFKKRYGKGKTMAIVLRWLYEQAGSCVDCGARLELQADHEQPRESFEDRLEADFIENMVLRCRRCNVIRRPSHQLGGKTFLTAEAALMWILLVLRPRTPLDFRRLCRLYGMSMADIRMQEAWAMAIWLDKSGLWDYKIQVDEGQVDILLWDDGAITRRPAGETLSGDPDAIFDDVPSGDVLAFTYVESGSSSIKVAQFPIANIPFSTYILDPRPRNDIAIQGKLPNLSALPPRGHHLLASATRDPEVEAILEFQDADGSHGLHIGTSPHSPRRVPSRDPDLDSFSFRIE